MEISRERLQKFQPLQKERFAMNQYNRLNDEARDAYSEPTYQIFAFETSDLMDLSDGRGGSEENDGEPESFF